MTIYGTQKTVILISPFLEYIYIILLKEEDPDGDDPSPAFDSQKM